MLASRFIFKDKPIGSLRVDQSDPDSEPYLFLELDPGGMNDIYKKQSVRLRVKIKNYISHGKYYAATGTKGYRWLESEMVRELDKVNDIDRSYYDKLVNEAVDTIPQYGDFEMFVSDDPYITERKQDMPKLMPCGDAKYATCFDCPHFNDDAYHMDCGKNYDISEVISSQVMNPPVETK